MDVKIDLNKLEGEMDTKEPTIPTNKRIDFSSLTNLSQIPIPKLGESLRQIRQNIRPWSDFIQIQNFKTVANVQRLSNRVLRNLAHFQSNYLIICVVLLMYCLLTSPLILIVLLGSMYGCYKIKQAATPITVFKKQLNTNQQCLVVNIATAPILYLVGAGAVMFWVMGASAFVVLLHAALYNIDALVTEETEGFLAETV
ncbi:prenylated Rab acceptor protein 1 [Bradysia coprophila]|uniref:prenylated Rab acceptor protein 1 n=1 Tax=Bradysia coprophila TaxID=38358 RepID=UPI00187D7B1D|nr:prenylated Rab acceptor protein 1 [Bradysia coprophila]